MLRKRGVPNAEATAGTLARAFADDLTISTSSVESMVTALAIIEEFCQWSGARVNWGKSEITGYDFKTGKEIPECRLNVICAKLKWIDPDNPIRLLGIRSSIKGSSLGEKRHIQASAKTLQSICV